MFPIITHDADRERIRARARLARDVLADLEEAALAAASRHTHQVDALKTELAEAQCQLDALATRTPVDMTVGLDDIRTILIEETHTTVRELLVLEDGQVQVVDSIHQLLAHVAMLSDAVRKAYADRDRAISGAADNANAAADQYEEEYQVLKGKVRALGLAIRPVNSAAAEVAARCDVLAAIDVVAQAVTELAGQIVDGGRGETARALAREQANANQIENELQAIEAVCEAAGMAATVEREDIPAWLAEHLTTRVEAKAKAKKAKKDEAIEEEAIEEEASDWGPWVVMRNDAKGRRFGDGAAGWTSLDVACCRYALREQAVDAKPRGATVVSLLEAEALVANDARIAAGSAELPSDVGGGAQ
jgi:hypothetical protein